MQLRHGTRVDVGEGGTIARIVDRVGYVHAELAWEGTQLRTLTVTGAVVHGAPIIDALLGFAHAIGTVTTMSILDWRRPTEIPVIADPGRLPPGAGGAILNVIAHLARWADVPALRYAGPYPTPALFATLRRSFHTTATEDEFTRDVMARALRVARDPIAIDFTPDPCERVAIPGGFVELRHALERVVHHGVTYERGGGVARLVDTEAKAEDFAVGKGKGEVKRSQEAERWIDRGGPALAAEVWFGDRPYARAGLFLPDGKPLGDPLPIPACTSPVIGRAFPDALRGVLAELVGELVPAPLAGDARELVATTPIAWADLGARAATHSERGFAVHAALWDRLAPHGMARVAQALAEALTPVAIIATTSALSRRDRSK